MADSQFAIDYLKKELGVDNNSNFSDKDKGIFKIITDWRDYNCYLDKIVDHLPNFTYFKSNFYHFWPIIG